MLGIIVFVVLALVFSSLFGPSVGSWVFIGIIAVTAVFLLVCILLGKPLPGENRKGSRNKGNMHKGPPDYVMFDDLDDYDK